MQWKNVTLVEEDGDPLRYGTAMIWAPVKSIYWGTKKPLLLTTPTVILHCFSPETQKRGRVVVIVSKRLKEAALWRGPMSQATGNTPGSQRSFALLVTAQVQGFLSL